MSLLLVSVTKTVLSVSFIQYKGRFFSSFFSSLDSELELLVFRLV